MHPRPSWWKNHSAGVLAWHDAIKSHVKRTLMLITDLSYKQGTCRKLIYLSLVGPVTAKSSRPSTATDMKLGVTPMSSKVNKKNTAWARMFARGARVQACGL